MIFFLFYTSCGLIPWVKIIIIIIIIIIMIIIMSLTPVSSSDKDIGGVPSMQSSYSAEMKRCGICMEEKRVHCKYVGQNPGRHCSGY